MFVKAHPAVRCGPSGDVAFEMYGGGEKNRETVDVRFRYGTDQWTRTMDFNERDCHMERDQTVGVKAHRGTRSRVTEKELLDKGAKEVLSAITKSD
ncbi:hypothetical protein GBA52_007209 [Prunus armeniaca]|nr:hypothetical protein GBA52_007209 [Prunus armeniaca]